MIAGKGLEVAVPSISVSRKDFSQSISILTVEKVFGIGVPEMISRK